MTPNLTTFSFDKVTLHVSIKKLVEPSFEVTLNFGELFSQKFKVDVKQDNFEQSSVYRIPMEWSYDHDKDDARTILENDTVTRKFILSCVKRVCE